jgi:hypothetical protein
METWHRHARERGVRDAERHRVVGLRKERVIWRADRYARLEPYHPAHDFACVRFRRDAGLKKNQARKSIGRMPWHQAPKKDVASCEKLRVAASRHRTVDIRMGKPGERKVRHGRMNT